MSQFDVREPTIHIVNNDAALLTVLYELLSVNGRSIRTFADGEAFLCTCAQVQAEEVVRGCVILEIQAMPMSGFEIFGRMQAMGMTLPALFLSNSDDEPPTSGGARQGTINIIKKPIDRQRLTNLVDQHLAFDCQQYRRRCHSAVVVNRMRTLTPREREVMDHIIGGKLNKQIADELSVGIKTVEAHRSKVMEKMAVSTLADLIRSTVDATLMLDKTAAY